MAGLDDAAFLAEARGWIETNVDVRGEIEQVHLRPWSTVLRVPTAGGNVFFKAAASAFAHDAAVTEALSGLRPDLVLAPLAVDRERSWMLLPDGGERLRELLARAPHPRPWYELLPAYADLQLTSGPELEELVAAGLHDLRLELLTGLAERLALELGETAPSGTGRVCEELAAYRIPATIQHDDLHDGNVFACDGYRIFDWGDSVASHPFASLVVALRGVAYRFELAEHDPDLDRLRDAYLKRFSAFGSLDELRRAAELARSVGMLSRALSWWRVASVADEPEEYVEGSREWFREFAAAVRD
jgi:hypothetical protein